MDSLSCQECEQKKAVKYCEPCQQIMCKLCDDAIHKNGKRKLHSRVFLCKNCGSVSKFICETCNETVCESCKIAHKTHDINTLTRYYTSVLIWDLDTLNPEPGLVNQVSFFFTSLYPNLKKIKIFGNKSYLDYNTDIDCSVECVKTSSETYLNIILIDISLLYKCYDQVIIISPRIKSFQPYFDQIISSAKVNKIIVIDFQKGPFNSPGILNHLKKKYSQSIQNLSKNGMSKDINEDLKNCSEWVLGCLKKNAEAGKLVFELEFFIESTAKTLRISVEKIQEACGVLEKSSKILVIERAYGEKKITMISLSINSVNPTTFTWVLESLKIDEILPTERAIQARFKEAFSYSFKPGEWKEVFEKIVNGQHVKKKLSNDFSFFSENTEKNPTFFLTKFKDNVSNSEVKVIYLDNHEWVSYENYLKCGDVLNVKSTKIWNSFAGYFSQYFLGDDYDAKAIPGGRYGCAQFLKYFGCDSLKECSLGKLNYIVQLAIDEDLLRYQKNLLVWTACIKNMSKEDVQIKVDSAKNYIEELLKHNASGISLAQLPGLLKKNYSFQLDLQELGFAKLKELVSIIPNVQIVKKANKHQYAILCKKDSYKKL